MIVLSRADALSIVYKSAADATKAIDFSGAAPSEQTDPRPPAVRADEANVDVEALIAAAEQELLSAIADRFAALRAAARAPTVIEPVSDGVIADLITPGHAVHLTGVTRPTLYRLCKDHPIGSPEGFSLWRTDEQRFLISRSRLERFLQCRPIRMRRVETKTPGA